LAINPIKLKIVAVGTGRDGTLSVADMIQSVFDRLGTGQRVMHEYEARQFYQAFCDYCETREGGREADIRAMIENCPYECIVGNGYAAVLPYFSQACGTSLKLLHLRRSDRAACIASIKRNCELFPLAFRYYSTSSDAKFKRMAAFHFDEMTQQEWDRLSLDEKIGWYYDKTHSLIRKYRGNFSEYVEITTESINDEMSRRAISRLVSGSEDIVASPTQLNSHSFIAGLPADRYDRMQWLFGRLNLNEVAADDVYAIAYFLEKFVAWTGYQIDGSIRDISPHDVKSRGEINAILAQAEEILRARLKDIDALRALNTKKM
jgi:hypothetical protein